MPNPTSFWFHRSRDIRWLATTAISIVALFAVAALVTDIVREKPGPGRTDPTEPSIRPTPVPASTPGAPELDSDPLMTLAAALIRSSRQSDPLEAGGAVSPEADEQVRTLFARAGATEQQQQAAIDYLEALGLPAHKVIDSEPLTRLREQAPADPVAALLAIDLAQEAHPTTALEWATDWVKVHDSDFLRRHAVLVAIRLGAADPLTSWLDDPAFQNAFSAPLRQRAVFASGDFQRISAYLWQTWGTYAGPISLVMALFAGLIWFVLTLNLERVPRTSIPLFLAAVLLGALSTFPVLVFGFWQDSRVGWGESTSLIDNLIRHTAGVALREELAKLLAATPLLLWLAWRGGREATALVLAGCVGLGFAIEENLGYFGSIPDGTVISRFLTANFLHIATTALSGLALYRLIRQGISRWDEALGTLLLVIAIHGGYNATLSSSDGFDGSLELFALILLGVLAWRFYDTAAALSPPLRRTISPLAVFVLGLALLLGMTYYVFLWNLPFWDATPIYGLAAVSIAPIAFLFINAYRDA